MKMLIVTLLAWVLSFFALADITQSQLTTSVQDRKPTDDLGSEVIGKADEITQVYFYTLVTDMAGQQLLHKWLHNGEVVAEIPLNIGSHYWRTWSSKRLLPAWHGNWQVQVWHGDTLLASQDFVFNLAIANY